MGEGPVFATRLRAFAKTLRPGHPMLLLSTLHTLSSPLSAQPPQAVAMAAGIWHTVARGDTLFDIVGLVSLAEFVLRSSH